MTGPALPTGEFAAVYDALGPFLAALDAVPRPADAEFLFDPDTVDGARRRRNLVRYLGLIRAQQSRLMLVSEAPGWRGMTFTGVPFVSARELRLRPGPVSGDPEGDGFEEPPELPVPWEASSRDVWRALEPRRGPLPLLWPVYPHHPFVPGDPRTNRPPRSAEVRAGTPVALALRDAFDGIPLVAVGRKAQGGLAASGIDVPMIRHPAHGGAADFAAGLRALGV